MNILYVQETITKVVFIPYKLQEVHLSSLKILTYNRRNAVASLVLLYQALLSLVQLMERT